MPEINEYWSAQAVEEYKGMLHEQKMQNYVYNCERCAPHVIHQAKVIQDGKLFCCFLGETPSSGIHAFGRTPREACSEFDTIWDKEV